MIPRRWIRAFLLLAPSAVTVLLTALLTTPAVAAVQDATPAAPETSAQHEARMAWWREAKFGMFIHWGLYAEMARGEWVMNKEKIAVADYAMLAAQFNPVKFDATEWVRFAKDAGMKYIVITSKHHDGFAMYGSKVSAYNIVDATPFRRDVMKELADACAKEGIRLGFYYSQAQDWHHPGGAIARGPWDAAQKGDFAYYLRTLAIPQIEELLAGYDPAVIWFDTPHQMTAEYGREIVQAVRRIRPETIINSRLMFHGSQLEGLQDAQLDGLRDLDVDYLSYRDRQIPDHPAPSWGRDWETCMTLNGSWGFNAMDQRWKSPQAVVQMLARVVGKGGNFLLNFGPTAEGEIPAGSLGIMKQVGVWLRANGEAIYGAGPCDLASARKPDAEAVQAKAGRAGKTEQAEAELDWLSTSRPASKDRPARIYLHVFKWPSGRLEVKGVTGRVIKASLLSDAKRAPLKFSQNDGTFSVELAGNAPDPIASVVFLECTKEESAP